MLPPVLSVMPLENQSATASEFVGSKYFRLPYWARSSLVVEAPRTAVWPAVKL